ncbi:MAG: hypothetical protein H7A24_13535 [Leptospiraceae bacterium]|nr:hypothetical protein [Leptospiraceae bacterium]MCP5512900.1 hypothetical protein [Leptospiraceae bacterium]
MKKLQFPFRFSLISIFVFFSFFLVFVYTEDFLLLDPIEKNGNLIIPQSVFLYRFYLTLVLSVVGGLISYYAFYLVQKEVDRIRLLLLDWGRKNLNELDLITQSPFPEFDKIREVFRASRFSHLARETEAMNLYMEEINKDQITRIFPSSIHIQINKIKNLDIAVYPQSSQNPLMDLVHIMELRNGCIILLAGTPITDTVTASYKSSLLSIMSLAGELNYQNEEDLYIHILNTVHNQDWKGLRFTFVYISGISEKIYYCNFQKLPILHHFPERVEELPTAGETEFPFQYNIIDPGGESFSEGEDLLFLSDTLLDMKKIDITVFLEDYKKQISVEKKVFSSSRELILYFTKSLNDWLKSKENLENYSDFLSLVAIRKKK